MSLTTDLKRARRDLTDLQAELPNFQALLDHNLDAAARLRAARAAPADQLDARGRVSTAQELLNQHKSDLEAARALVSDLEAREHQEATVRRIKQLESTLEAGRDDFAAAALDAYNAFVVSVMALKSRRAELVATEDEANRLREQLKGDRAPQQAQALFLELGVPRRLGLYNHPAKTWALRMFTSANSPLKSRLCGLFDQLLMDPNVSADTVTLERKAA